MNSRLGHILVLKKIRYLYKLNEIDVKTAAKKIQKVQTFQELHDIMVAYANLGDYKSQNLPAENPRRCPTPRAPDYEEWDPFEILDLDEIFDLNKDGEKI